MAKKLFVGGLSWGTVDASLRQAFERYGEVSDAKVIMDRETGRSRGFGFVTMPDDAAATTAISDMDGGAIDGRSVKVSEAQERAPRPGGGGGFGGPRPSGDREYGNRDFGGGGAAPGGFGGGRDFGGGAPSGGGYGGGDFGGGGAPPPSSGGRDRNSRGRSRSNDDGGGRDW